MGATFPGKPVPEVPLERRLDSWKEIASYLGRDVTTVQRWEKREGMPVHRHLHDKRGSVYALGSELDAWKESRKLSLAEEEQPQAFETPMSGPGSGEGRFWGWRLPRWYGLAAGIVVLGLLVATYVVFRGRTSDRAQPRIRSLAVLPLKNLTGDPAQEYLADGMTEALTGSLSGIRDLRVTSRTSVMHFKDTQLTVPEIAKTLNVDAIVEGSVIREGNRIRVHAQLIRAATDEHFWSATYDRDLQDVLALESEVAQSIANKVAVTITGQERERLAKVRPVSPEAYEAYLKGRFALEKSKTRADIEGSLADFQKAIDEDPTFAPAYVSVAEVYTLLGLVGVGAPPAETRPKVISAARNALQLDPDLAKAHSLLADTLQEEWHWADAEAEYRRALELNPNDADTHARYALWMLCQGRVDEALTLARRGRELDPLSIAGGYISWILFQSRRYDDSIRESRNALAVQPDNGGWLTTLGFALIANNQPEDAVQVLEKAVLLTHGSPASTGILIRAYAHAGRRADALKLLDDLNRRRQSGYVPAAAFVNAYLGLGDNEEAFAWLEEAYKEQSNILQFLRTHPYFDPIRSDPRFAGLVRRVGLE
jgi:TolB-like protein/Flp pilus assembly protein TadD